MSDNPIQVGGPYQESENHVPDPTDIVSQFNTEGVGAHNVIEKVSPIFEVDKVKTAQEIQAALDPENTTVSASKVLLPEGIVDNETAKRDLLAVADARVEKGVVVGGPDPAEEAAALEGDEGVLAAVDQDASNASSNSTGSRGAGEHEGTVSTEAGRDDTSLVAAGNTTGTSGTATTSTNGDATPDASAASNPTASTTAKKTTSTRSKAATEG